MINEQYKAMLGGKSVIRELSEYATNPPPPIVHVLLQHGFREGMCAAVPRLIAVRPVGWSGNCQKALGVFSKCTLTLC